MNIIEAVHDEKVFGKFFPNKKTWKNWFIFLKAVYGLEMTAEEQAFYYKCTSRKLVPEKGFDEFYAIIGRRGGKSYISSLIAVYEAVFGDWEKGLGAGEVANIFVIATEKRQAKIMLDYMKAFLDPFPDLRKDNKIESISLLNGIEITIKTANFRATRGFSTAVILLDELAFFRSEDSANPAEEIVTALIPSLLPNAKLVGISTPYGKWGYLYDTYRENYGDESADVLIWQATTKQMNPIFSDKKIQRLSRKDPTAAKTEYNAIFREDVSSYLTEDTINKAIDNGIMRRPPEQGNRYFAFCDPSGGKHDSYTFAIAHRDGDRIVNDYVDEFLPPFSPTEKTKLICEVLKDYQIGSVIGDKYAGVWVSSAFKDNGIRYLQTNRAKSDIYLEFAGCMNMERIRLLDNDRLKHQLLTLERSTHGGGRDTVDHIRGMKDDVANSVAGVSVEVFRRILREPTKAELESRVPRLGESPQKKKYRSTVEEMDAFMSETGAHRILNTPRDIAMARKMAAYNRRKRVRGELGKIEVIRDI